MDTGRLEAFSDGEIAIIITIAILIIDVPNGNDWPDIAAILPIIICYVISFIVVGTYWVNHHHLLQATKHVDGRILWANLMFLMFLSFFPVTTGWVGKSGFSMIPVRVYVLVNLADALSYIILERAIMHSHDCEVFQDEMSNRRKELWTLSIELLALLVSFSPEIHHLSCLMLVVAVAPWIIPDLRIKRVFDQTRNER